MIPGLGSHITLCSTYLFCSTEAGKLALNLTQETTSNTDYCKTTTGNTAAIVSRKATPIILPATAKKKIITIRAEQIIGKSGPNILKRVDPDSLSGPPTKFLVTRAGIPLSTASKNTVRIGVMSVPLHSFTVHAYRILVQRPQGR
jgi:hypothetical protein